jgi:hypothetical protein
MALYILIFTLLESRREDEKILNCMVANIPQIALIPPLYTTRILHSPRFRLHKVQQKYREILARGLVRMFRHQYHGKYKDRMILKVAAAWLALHLRIREVPHSKLSLKTGYPD